MICPRCNTNLIWDSDFDAEDYGIEQDGIVSIYTCPDDKCNIIVTIYDLFDDEELT
tara:strand:+ start:3057 stop:3224 length:168 start_codon:yes stop_codon:yes gene_type:complete